MHWLANISLKKDIHDTLKIFIDNQL